MALARNQGRVLTLLATSGGELAGIEVAEALGGMARSSVYAALAALQRDGLVLARWDLDGSHPRRLVRISAEGQRALARVGASEPQRAGGRAGRTAEGGAS